MWFHIIDNIRSSGDDRQIEILYTDLASNDFSVLFRMMQGMQGDKKFAFQKKFPDVFVHGCGTGFHKQLMSNYTLSGQFTDYNSMPFGYENMSLISLELNITKSPSSKRIFLCELYAIR